MKIQFTFASGPRAGQSEEFSGPFVQVGRHPHCDLRFDPDRDLDVSSRHATISLQSDLFTLRDLGSTNGTFVNGKRVTSDHVLADGDEIQFGKQGPKVTVRINRDQRPGPSGKPEPEKAAATPPQPKPSDHSIRRTPPGATTTRIKVEVARQTEKLRRTTIVLLGLLVILAGAYLWQSVTAAKRIERERTDLLRLADSLTVAYQSMQVNVTSLQGALDSAQAETARLRARIGEGGDAAALRALRTQLQAAEHRQQSISAAASLDAAAINKANQDAVAVVVVEFADSSVRTGSGFAVRSDANGAFLVTNRHVVTGQDGSAPVRIGVIFNGSRQNFKADLVSLHPNGDVDLALIRATIRGGTPTVRSLATTDPETGDPVATIGYPLGLDMTMGGDWQQVGVSASLNTGTMSKVLPNQLVITGYGAAGMSGSPIFDRGGNVVGIVFGGQRDSNGRVVLGVPVRFVNELLAGH
ncbi:MAG: trypsin-like peptidase domain-containing protein [Gemmatimonadota bacterium]